MVNSKNHADDKQFISLFHFNIKSWTSVCDLKDNFESCVRKNKSWFKKKLATKNTFTAFNIQ